MQQLIAELEKRVANAKNEIKSWEAEKARKANEADANIRQHSTAIVELDKAIAILKAAQ